MSDDAWPPAPRPSATGASSQRTLGLILCGVGVALALVGWDGASKANESAYSEANLTPWIVTAVVGGVLFLAGVFVAATAGSAVGSNSAPGSSGGQPATSYPTANWTRSELSDIRSGLTDRGVDFSMVQGELVVAPSAQAVTDRVIFEVLSDASEIQ